MSVQQFCLRWNNHQPNFISVCSSLLHHGTLVDVTLAAEGRQLQAHKIVLSACSSYFQALFTSNPCQHPIVILKDVQYNDLKTMVDFMYYGEVNVSQEQLPHILKTAEMLKIKGLAEMPADAATLTKSESKSSEQAEQMQGSGSGTDSIWGSTESQFQQQQQHHHQQNQTHHNQLRRSPSPGGISASPATRRKRLRKSSNNGSGERNSDEHSSIEGTANINLSQMSQMSFGGNTSLSHAIQTKIIKESVNTDADTHPQDSSQESIDDVHSHHIQQIKPEADISVQQSIPIDISGTPTPSDHDTPSVSCSQSQSGPLIPSTVTTPAMGTKRNRFLIRQPRIKRDSDTLVPQTSPDIEFDPLSSTHMLCVPPRIERHASEPAPNKTPSSPHLLSVPQSTPFLVKQHSHPLLPSQQSSGASSTGSHLGFSLHRQFSHPLSSTITSPPNADNLMEPIFPTTTPCVISPANNPISSSSSAAANLMHFVTTTSSLGKPEVDSVKGQNLSTSTSSVILLSESPTSGSAAATSSSSFDHTPTLRVKTEELQRSVSSPQTNREIISLESPRSSHCPVIRQGPALGCNFCWNTIDGHGRILRRKTKYHCPECQTNLCIVPCFQEYHERQSSSDTPSNNDNNKSYSSTTAAGLRHYSKTESI